MAACGKPPKDELRQSIGRLTEAKANGYGEEIQRAKGVTLVERRRQKVLKGQIDRDTGEIYARSGWRSVKNIVASVVTRVGDWTLAQKKNEGSAIKLAEARMTIDLMADSPVEYGRQARGLFWNALWAAKAMLYPEERYPAPAASAKRPEPGHSWAELLKSWGVAPLQPATA